MTRHPTIRLAAGIAIAAAVLAPATAAFAVQPVIYEESVARAEEGRIIVSPIAGIQNSKWFDYRININETQKELASDLRHASDIEDQRDAWEEYAHELKHERTSYVNAMAKKGYRIPQVYFED